MKRTIGSALAAAALTGCISAAEISSNRAAELPRNSHPSYVQGFKDGCYSITSQKRNDLGQVKDAAFVRDEAKMRSDTEYRIGWGDGAMKCDYSAPGTMFLFVPR